MIKQQEKIVSKLKSDYYRLFGDVAYEQTVLCLVLTYFLIKKIVLSEQLIIGFVVATILSMVFYFYYKTWEEKKRASLPTSAEKPLIDVNILQATFSVGLLSVLYDAVLDMWQNPIPFIAIVLAVVIGVVCLHLKDKIVYKDKAPTLKDNLKDNL